MEPMACSTSTLSMVVMSRHKRLRFILDGLALNASIQTRDVFKDPSACITFDLVEAMDTLCRDVDEDPPRRQWLTRSLHLALLLLLTAVLFDLSFDIYTPKEVDG